MSLNKEYKDRKWGLSEFYEKRGIYVLPEHEAHTINYSDGIEIEKYILKAIKNTENISDNSDELLHSIKDWPSRYHLGAGRSNIFRALDLSTKSNVLEFGSGCGALTRYLGETFNLVDGIEGSSLRARIACERCRDLENVKIFSSNIKNIKFVPSYDITTLIGVLEYAPIYMPNQNDASKACLSLLEIAKTSLKERGILIIAIENKIGIKYWSGFPEDHTGRLFDSINGYPDQLGPITFSRQELKKLLQVAGFSNIDFYYCFPDYKFASTIFSDIGNEKDFYLHNWIQVPFASYDNPRSYSFHEGLVNKTLSESGILREFANSFLVIASRGKTSIINQPDWIAKQFSTERRRQFQCMTTLKVNPKIYIEKENLFQNSGNNVFEDNNIKIKQEIVDSKWYDGNLMIFDLFKALYGNDFKIKIIDMLKRYHGELLNRYYTKTDDEAGFPLLYGNSIDYIFSNIINQGLNELLSIDNEWHVQGYIPIDYVLYRCIYHNICNQQNYLIGKKVVNSDSFIIKLIKTIYPNYGKNRHKKNKLFEISFQNLVKGTSVTIKHEKMLHKLINYSSLIRCYLQERITGKKLSD
jgi:hypothetical protein